MNMLKPPFPTPPSSGTIPYDGSYTMSPPIVGSASLESSPATSTGHEFPQNQGRRPSLPQIFDTPPHPVHSHSMSSSLAQGSNRHHGKSSGRPSFSSSRRPRSAGTDADTSSSTPGRLRGKLSLLSMFKKSAGETRPPQPVRGLRGVRLRRRDSGTASGIRAWTLQIIVTATIRSSQSRDNLLGIHGFDNRARGDSFGSMSTSTDASLPQTPGPGPVLGLDIRSPGAGSLDLPSEQEENSMLEGGRSRADSTASRTNYLIERERQQHRARTMSPPRSRAPALDIDIRAISSHAQAEALVQRAQKSIIDMEDVDIELPGLGLVGSNPGAIVGIGPGNGGTLSVGRTPLSAKLGQSDHTQSG
ncbi:hypothetical protein BD310DRAFT_716867 [Dichomitus squalens]|uniref:Uncharacterized protein n=1 Tax=Dichomitus squalens TaxID=114155 RepID=A0A4Q9PLH9_9APHY|nr:hypothetical protein BD310DRAFT_716867 [Dichomitus squalens]